MSTHFHDLFTIFTIARVVYLRATLEQYERCEACALADRAALRCNVEGFVEPFEETFAQEITSMSFVYAEKDAFLLLAVRRNPFGVRPLSESWVRQMSEYSHRLL